LSPASKLRGRHAAALTLTLVAMAWGALAFGAVYQWAYVPLAIGCGIIGTATLILERDRGPRIATMSAGLAAIGVAIAAQLVPLPPATLAWISPNTDAFLRQYDLAYALQAGSRLDGASESMRALSIVPGKTLLGLALFVSFALLFLGLSRLLSAVGANSIVRPLVYFGFVLAIVGVVQWGLTIGNPQARIYGFWKPKYGGTGFGPFINPNHFAGWMLMALPLALAVFYEALQRTMHDAPPNWRDRGSIVGLPSFGSLLFFGLASAVMGLSLFMTRSRSGIAAFALGSVLAGWTVFRQQASTAAKGIVTIAFVLLLGGTASWAGVDTMIGKFAEQNDSLQSVGGRIEAWRDTLGIVGRFPLTGTGFDTYGAAMVMYQTGSRTVHFQEAHNDYLQLAAEGGLLIGLPVLGALVVFVRGVRRRFLEAPKTGSTYWLRVGAVIGLVSIGLQSLVEFSLQMPGNAVLFAVLAAVALHRSPNLRSRADPTADSNG
jgi:O-antigen ligase